MYEKNEYDIMANWDNKSDIVVTVICITYNQELYIRDALDSILMQMTNFPFEIFVHDDCSCDSTKSILKEYEKRYPHLFNVVYEEENLFSKKDGSLFEVIKANVKGKYVAICEGDDYWIDEYKLQKQFDALEKNSNLPLCVNRVEVVDDNKKEFSLRTYYPPIKYKITKDMILSSKGLAKYAIEKGYPFQTSGYMMRSSVYTDSVFDSIVNDMHGDELILRKAILYGGVIYLNEIMSCYRMFSKGSYTASLNFKTEIEKYNQTIHYVYAETVFDRITHFIYHDSICIGNFERLVTYLSLVDTTTILKDIVKYCDGYQKNASIRARLKYLLFKNMPIIANYIFVYRRRIKKYVKYGLFI